VRIAMRTALGLLLGLTSAGMVAACGASGSSGTKAPASVSGAGCAPIAGTELVVLDDDKKLQTADNIIAAINVKSNNPALVAAVDKVADALTTDKLIALNKSVDVDRKTPENAAKEFATTEKLTDGITKGPGGALKIGAADFSEAQILGNLYKIALDAAGYSSTVQQIGKREVYEPQLEKGDINVTPEYAGSLTEYLNGVVNGANATTLASGDVDKTVTALTGLGGKRNLVFGKASAAADQNAFAVTKGVADKYSLKTLSDFAAKCSGKDTVLAGPAECPQRPFCQPGLEKTYSLQVGSFSSLDAGGPQTIGALKAGKATLGLVFSSAAY
jgi:osmoprotectant transport system substrate-binding protein